MTAAADRLAATWAALVDELNTLTAPEDLAALLVNQHDVWAGNRSYDGPGRASVGAHSDRSARAALAGFRGKEDADDPEVLDLYDEDGNVIGHYERPAPKPKPGRGKAMRRDHVRGEADSYLTKLDLHIGQTASAVATLLELAGRDGLTSRRWPDICGAALEVAEHGWVADAHAASRNRTAAAVAAVEGVVRWWHDAERHITMGSSDPVTGKATNRPPDDDDRAIAEADTRKSCPNCRLADCEAGRKLCRRCRLFRDEHGVLPTRAIRQAGIDGRRSLWQDLVKAHLRNNGVDVEALARRG